VNVALVTERLEGGGAERVVRRLAAGLARRGHGTFVYCLRQTTSALADQMAAEGVILRQAHSHAKDFRLPVRLAAWLWRDRIEVVHTHSCAALLWVFPAAKLLRKPILHVWHGWSQPAGRQAGRYHRLAESLTRFVDCVGINSEWLRQRLPRCRVARAAAHLPNGLDLEPIPHEQAQSLLETVCGQQPGRPVILTVANLRPEKDIRTLLEAFGLLRRQWPKASLVCVGAVSDGTYWDQVRRTVARLNLARQVYFTGPVPEAWRLMAAADAFCLSSRQESMPNVIIEAMSQRVPIIATAVGDIGCLGAEGGAAHWLLAHNWTGLLVPPGQPTALAAAIECTLRDRVAARTRAARAYQAYRCRYNLMRMVQAYERAYLECCRVSADRAGQPDELQSRRAPRPGVTGAEQVGVAAGPNGLVRRNDQEPAIQRFKPNYPVPRASAWGKPASRPRVLMLGPASPQIGGMVTAIDLLMRSPLSKGYELHRFATVAPTSAIAADLRGRGSGCDLSGPPLGPALQVPRSWRHARSAWLGAVRGVRAAVRHSCQVTRLAAVILERRIDLLHIHTCSRLTFYRNLLDLAVGRLLGRAVVLHIRGGQFDQFCHQAGFLGQWLIRRGLAAADAVVVLSERWRVALRPYAGRTPVFVVPNGVEVRPARVRPPSDGRGCRFLYLGPLTEAKGLSDLITAAARLREGGLSFELVIAGPEVDQPRSWWEKAVEKAGLGDLTTFAGPVVGESKLELLMTADCLVHPSHSEGMPHTILEAAAAGLPVIATAVGSVPEVIATIAGGHLEAVLVPAKDPVALAERMERLARAPAVRQRIAQAMYGRVAAHFELSGVADRLAEIYEIVLRTRGLRAIRRSARRHRSRLARQTGSPATQVLTPSGAICR